MSASFLAYSGTPGADDFIASHIPHSVSLSAAVEFFENNLDAASCFIARIPASSKNIDEKHHVWDDIREKAADIEEVTRTYVIDAIKSGRYHNLHEQQRQLDLIKSYDDVKRFKGRAVYFALLVLFLLALSMFLPAGYFEIYLYPIIAGYAVWIAISAYVVHLGCRGYARDNNPPAEEADILIEKLSA